MARGPWWLYGLAGLAAEKDPWQAGGGWAFWTRGKEVRPSPAMQRNLAAFLMGVFAVSLGAWLVFADDFAVALLYISLYCAFGALWLRSRWLAEQNTRAAEH